MRHIFRFRHRSAIALAGAAGALALAGCGSAGTGTSAAAASGQPNAKVRADFLKVSECMRAHGVADFPDPSSSGGLALPQGINPQSPTFQSAMQVCSKLLPGGGPGAHPMSAAQRRQLLANAQCMRTHGIPDFPDPTFLDGGVRVQFPPDVNPNSPAFENAAKACQGAFGGPKGGHGFVIAVGAKGPGGGGK